MRIIRLKEVIDSTGLAWSTIYKYIGEGTFPNPVSLGDRCVGWVDSEVHNWILGTRPDRSSCSAFHQSSEYAGWLIQGVRRSPEGRGDAAPHCSGWLGLGTCPMGFRYGFIPEYGFSKISRCGLVIRANFPEPASAVSAVWVICFY
jgi:prophage regulatory protein